ncbi:MAG TPA: mandelate racemase/muconate lactonizing enzyme family protein [Chloroflexota bacterium]|nr:mandelate racemase/muconate lactonizing enzyme family protein [Chloroflexota bacterium]
MRITDVKVFELEGTDRSGMAIYEIPRGGLTANAVTSYRHTFTEIYTDDGVTGLAYGGSTALKAIGSSLIGEDPFAVEGIWDRIYTRTYRRFDHLADLSTLDVALWDLIGKAKGEPVYRLLGGPCQPRIRAYAGMLGFQPEPAAAAERSVEFVEKGFTALKWYLPYNATAGEAGLNHNVALIKAVREAVGAGIDIMVDCLLSKPTENSILYAIRLARRLEEYNPTWLEEPLYFDDLDAYARLAGATRIPLAFGEHWYNRWQFQQVIASGAATVLQPGILAAGGVTELRKIITLASAHGIPVVPHANESCRNAIHLLFANPARICPLGEWGEKINRNTQHFFRDFYEPRNGYFELPNGHGFGYELDPSKIVRRFEL